MSDNTFKQIAESISKVLEKVKYKNKNHLDVGVYKIVNIYLKNEHVKENTLIIKNNNEELFLTFNDDEIDSKEYKYMVIIKYEFGNINFYTNSLKKANAFLKMKY